MHMQWDVTAMWAGNLQNVPLVGTVQDYKQHAPGLITVTIRCEAREVPEQVAKFTDPNEPFCSEIHVIPYFPQLNTKVTP